MNDWLEAEQRAERAQQLLESHRWPEALDELDAALEINPHNAEWHGNRGYLLDQMGRHEDARAAYRQAVALEPDNCEWLIALGLDLTRLGELDEAIALFDRVARLDATCELAYCQRTAIYAYVGEHDKAEEMFYLAQQVKPDCPHCFYHLGASLAARALWERAIYCWSRVLEIAPGYCGANQRLAEAWRARGQLERARQYYLAELRLDPGNVDVLEAMARLLLEADAEPAEVRMKYLQILELDPDHTAAKLGLAQLALAEDASPDVAPILAEILAREPANASAHRLMGLHVMRSGRFAEARTHLTKALTIDPNDCEALMAMGTCLAHLGCSRLAASYFERLLALEPQAIGARHNLAVCYFSQGRVADGVEECRAILETDSCYVPALHKLAVIYAHLGRWGEARIMARRGLESDPRHRELRRLLRRLRWLPSLHAAAWAAVSLTRILRFPAVWRRRIAS